MAGRLSLTARFMPGGSYLAGGIVLKNEKPHARGKSGAGPAPKMRGAQPDNRKPMQESFNGKRALPDAWWKIYRQACHSRQEYKSEEATICGSAGNS